MSMQIKPQNLARIKKLFDDSDDEEQKLDAAIEKLDKSLQNPSAFKPPIKVAH
jgi:hypothetical protein